MRLLLLNPTTDVDDPVHGFTADWIDALAERVDFIHVITMRAGRYSAPENVRVYSMGQEKGYSRPRRLLELQRHALGVLRRDSVDACFVHMSPMLTIVTAPLLRLWSVPIVTWYAHREVTTRVRLAHHLSAVVVSPNDTSYRYRQDKVVSTGHGIDLQVFAKNGLDYERPALLLSVGRLSPIKDQLTLINAVGILRGKGLDIRCALVGDEESSHLDYAQQLRKRVADLELTDVVEFVGPVPHAKVVDWYRRCFAHVNLCPTGALDKAPLEAMSCGKSSLVANEGFRETLGRWSVRLLFRHGSEEDLAFKIEDLLGMRDAELTEMSVELVQSVAKRHSLDRLADRLVEVLSATSGGRARSSQPLGR